MFPTSVFILRNRGTPRLRPVFKLLRQSSRPNRPYPKINRSLAGIDKLIVGLLAEQLVCARPGAGCSVDTETASTCRVEGLDRVANPPRALLLASHRRFRCHSHQIYGSVT